MDLTKAHQPAPEFDGTAQSALINALIEAVIVIDEDGLIERVNQAAIKMFGWSEDESVGQDVSILMPEPDHSNHRQYIDRYLATREARIIGIGREVTACRKDGTLFPAHLAISEVGWRGTRRFVGMVRDLTDDKAANERKLQQTTDMIAASRLTTMGEMAAAMAHEINQPLAAIANYASAGERLLQGGPDNNDDVTTALGSIKQQAHRAGEIIRKLRSFVRPADPGFEQKEVAMIVDEIRALAELDARANNISMTIEISNNLPAVVADGLQIQQVILNLIRNGIDAMDDCGPGDRTLQVRGYVAGPDTVRVDVVDRGCGISADVREHLFDAFYTTKSNGMGMGLAISRTIVKSHGGQLGFESNPEGGTTFYIELPTKVA